MIFTLDNVEYDIDTEVLEYIEDLEIFISYLRDAFMGSYDSNTPNSPRFMSTLLRPEAASGAQELEIVFEPEPYWDDPNAETRKEILEELEK